MAQRKYTIADALGLSGNTARDLTKGYQREVRAIPRGARYQGAISRSRPTAAQELAQLLTPDTRGGAEFAQKLTPAIENVPLLGGLLSLVDARRQYQAGNTGQAAGLGILAALGAIPGGKGVNALNDIRKASDDVYQVMEANTTAGRVIGDKMLPISFLKGGVSNAADDAKRVNQLVKQMSSPEGYISRLIVDDAGNVIEGQHRLEALRRLGVKEVPVTQYADLERIIPFNKVKDAAKKAQDIHPDQANQIAKNLAEIFADEGGDLAEIALYSPPSGFEKAWSAALEAITKKQPASVARKLSSETFDPSVYKITKKEMPSILNMIIEAEKTADISPDKIAIEDLIGRPFISTMADRTAAGRRLTSINNTQLDLPVDLQGGQDFMFAPTTQGALWASAKNPVSAIRNVAGQLYKDTGKKPLFLPFRMAGSGSDFATMTGETMMSFANSALGKADKTRVNNLIKKHIPDFAGIGDPKGYAQFRALSGDKRKAVQADMDKFVSKDGGLTLNQTRMAIVDPNQIDQPSYFLQNVGEIDPTAAAIAKSGHPSYEAGFAGRPMGILSDPVNVAELLPNFQKAYGITDPFAYAGQNTKWTPEQAAARGLKSLNANTGKYLRSAISSGIITEDMARIIAGRR